MTLRPGLWWGQDVRSGAIRQSGLIKLYMCDHVCVPAALCQYCQWAMLLRVKTCDQLNRLHEEAEKVQWLLAYDVI